MLTKTAQFITILPQTQNKDISENISKNIQIIVFNLSTIQSLFPLLFYENLTDYLQLNFILLENQMFISQENILKSTILCLLKVLKTFAYYSDSETFMMSFHSNAKLQNFNEIQKECASKFYAFFNEGNIEKLTNIIIMQLLPLSTFSKSQNEEALIENGF
jgi:hypothetical protein